jgi:hypothetical protein
MLPARARPMPSSEGRGPRWRVRGRFPVQGTVARASLPCGTIGCPKRSASRHKYVHPRSSKEHGHVPGPAPWQGAFRHGRRPAAHLPYPGRRLPEPSSSADVGGNGCDRA